MRLEHLLPAAMLLLSVPALATTDASQALDEWRPDLALERLDESPEEGNPDWQRLRGATLISLGEAEAALSHLERAVELAPEAPENHWQLVVGLSARINDVGMFGRMRLARRIRDALEAAVELDPANPEYRYGLMQYLLQAPGIAGGSDRRAREQHEAIVSLDPRWGRAAEALLLTDDGQTAAAMTAMLEAWDNGDGVARMALPIVFAAQSLEDWNTARQVLTGHLASSPGDPAALYQVGRTAAFSGEATDAGLAALHAYVDRPHILANQPGRAAAFWRMGQIHRHMGESKAARAAFEQALAEDPEFEQAEDALNEIDKMEDAG